MIAPANDLRAAARAGSRIGHLVELHATIGSTNDRARALLAEPDGEGVAVVAEEQIEGRGRRGRTWSSPPGVNLLMSVGLRPDLAARDAWQLGQAVALAARSACSTAGPIELKWPNDLVTRDGRKVGGLLIETAVDGERLAEAVVGIGINVNWRTADMPSELASSASSLFELAGTTVDRAKLLGRLLDALESELSALEAGRSPLDRYRAAAAPSAGRWMSTWGAAPFAARRSTSTPPARWSSSPMTVRGDRQRRGGSCQPGGAGVTQIQPSDRWIRTSTRTSPTSAQPRRDRAAFGVLYRRYLDRVYGYCFYLLGDHHDAEDATERTFLAALGAIDGFRDQGATFRSWLFRIAHNQIANALRSRGRRPTSPLDLVDEPVAADDPAAESPHRRTRAASDAPCQPCRMTAGRCWSCASWTACRPARSRPCSSAARARSACSNIAPSASWDLCSSRGSDSRACNVSGSAVFAGA